MEHHFQWLQISFYLADSKWFLIVGPLSKIPSLRRVNIVDGIYIYFRSYGENSATPP